MASSTIANYTTVPTSPAATIFAELRYGTNGSDGGAPECLIGHSGTDASTSRMVWDDTDDDFDSNNVGFAIVIPPSGGAANPDSLEVSGAVPQTIQYSLVAYGTISSVQVMAGVQINASASVSTLIIQFFKGGVLTDSFDSSSGPAVDTTTATNPVAVQVLTVTPTNSDNDRVQISGDLRMTAPAGTYPDVNDIFAQVFILTGSGSGGGIHKGPPATGGNPN